MAIFQQVQASQMASSAAADYSPEAKLRELRAEVGSAAFYAERENMRNCDGEGARPAAAKDERRASVNGQRRKRSANSSHAHAAAAAAAADGSSKPALPRQPSNVHALHERRQQEAATQKAREHRKEAAERLLKEWQSQTHGDIYAMMGSAHRFVDLFQTNPLEGVVLTRGDVKALKKGWHKLAARLHPDRQRGNTTSTQVLAEEIFKLLSIAYEKEVSRLGG